MEAIEDRANALCDRMQLPHDSLGHHWIMAALKHERELCAKIAEGHFDLRHADKARYAGHAIASSIRSGAQP